MDGFMVGAILAMGLFLVANFMNQKAIRKLAPEQLRKLVTQFGTQRLWSMGLLLLLMASYFLILRTKVMDSYLAMGIYLGVLMLFLIVQLVTTSRKLVEMGFDPEYIKTHRLTSVLKFVAILTFCGLMLYTNF